MWAISFSLLALATGCTPVTVTLQEFPTTPDAVRSLRGGQVDAVYGVFPAMAYAARESVGTLEAVRRQFQTLGLAIALAREATALRDALDAALAAVMEDGSYSRIIDSWALSSGRLDPPEGAGELPEAGAVPQLTDGVLRVGMDTSFAPMGFRDEAEQLAGVDVELARALGEQLGVEVEIVSMDFSALFGALESGEIDAVMSALTVTEERAAQYLLVEYLRGGSSILVQQGNPLEIEYPAQLCGRTVGVQEGTVQVEQLREITCY
jgi:ABC-type amino acid transport substrate-binding protein